MSLVTYLPFNEKQKEQNFSNNLLDYSTWKLNTIGSQSGWNKNGESNENKIIKKENPMDKLDIVWATEQNDATKNADGGYVSGVNDEYTVDSTKKYRHSVWIRRENIGGGRTYLGCKTGSTVRDIDNDSAINTNPYFLHPIPIENTYLQQEEWYLIVAHIHPYNLVNTGEYKDVDTGVYNINGVKLTDDNNYSPYTSIKDFKWSNDSVIKDCQRCFLYNSNTIDERQYFYRPRVDLCDGNEPSINDLLSLREADNIYDKTDVDKSYNIETIEYNINREEYGKIGANCISTDDTGYIELKKINNSLSWSNIFENNFTVACWIKIDNIHEAIDNSVFGYGASGANKFLHLNIRRKRAFFGFFGNDYTNASYLWEDNDWHHIAFVGDKDNMKQRIYIDGIEIGNRTVVSWLNFLGSEYTPKILKYSTHSLDGCMNDFRIYDEAFIAR